MSFMVAPEPLASSLKASARLVVSLTLRIPWSVKLASMMKVAMAKLPCWRRHAAEPNPGAMQQANHIARGRRSHRQPAIERNDLPRHVVRCRRGEVQRQQADLAEFADTLQRHLRFRAL